jgi:hypothetical protein
MEVLQAEHGADISVRGAAAADGGEADLADRKGESELIVGRIRAPSGNILGFIGSNHPIQAPREPGCDHDTKTPPD